MRMSLWFLPFLAVAFTLPAHADDAQPCDSTTVEAVARWAEAGANGKLVSWNKPDGLVAAAACKAMPNAPGTTVAAIAFDISREKMSGYADGYKLQVIALVEAGKVVAATQSILEEDASTEVGRNSYRIDTARYILSKDVRAFGVVFYSSARGASCPEANSGEELTLWIREGEHLRAIFGANLYGWVLLDGEPCAFFDNKDVLTESARMTIGVEKTSSHGFADLSITAHVTHTLSNRDRDLDTTSKRTVRKVLKYDGQSYGPLNMFRTFWYPKACPMCPGED
ncbi:MAG: multidrug ABC transporter ATPase [Betaproteobacteria bacterium]|nr:multidrug ABC transporter ATPase [Betaproteobacteria bacterium]